MTLHASSIPMRDFALSIGGRSAETIFLMEETCSVRYVTASGNLSNVISLSMFASTFVLVILRALMSPSRGNRVLWEE